MICFIKSVIEQASSLTLLEIKMINKIKSLSIFNCRGIY